MAWLSTVEAVKRRPSGAMTTARDRDRFSGSEKFSTTVPGATPMRSPGAGTVETTVAWASATLGAPARVEHLQCPLRTDDRRQRDGQAEPVVETEPREVGDEPGFRGRDPEVGRQRQAEPPSDGRALDRRDDRGPGGEQPDGLVVQVP